MEVKIMVCFKSLKNIGACQGLKEQQDANLDAKVGQFYQEICENKSGKYMNISRHFICYFGAQI